MIQPLAIGSTKRNLTTPNGNPTHMIRDEQNMPKSASESLNSLTPATPPSNFLETISEILTIWQSGLLAHENPDEPPILRKAFIRRLSELEEQPWGSLQNNHISFLQQILLTNLADSLVKGTTCIEDAYIPAVVKLLKICKPTRVVLSEAVFVVLRLHDTTELAVVITDHTSLCDVLSTSLGKLLPRLQQALNVDITTTPSPPITPAIKILHNLLKTCTSAALKRHETGVREMVHPLLEHPSAAIRVPGVELLTLLTSRCGVSRGSTTSLTSSLLWNDAETCLLAIPLLTRHLPYVDTCTRHTCEKRVMGCITALTKGYQDGEPCALSAKAAVELLPCAEGMVVRHGQRFLVAMGAFLVRVSVLVSGGKLEKLCVGDVCKGIVKGVERCWIGCDGFRMEVFKGCLVCLMEIDDKQVWGSLKEVVLTLARCHPGRMGRLIRDVRTSVDGLSDMGRVVSFLENVETIVESGEMRKVETGRLVERFFPEVNEF